MYALGVTQFIMPHQFVMGGLTGVAVLINYAFGLPVSLMVLIMNALLLLMAFRILGWEFLVKTIVGVGSLTLFIALFERLLAQQYAKHRQIDLNRGLCADRFRRPLPSQ